MPEQLQFIFDRTDFRQEETEAELMREQVRRTWHDWASRMGLPLNEEVEVVLQCGRCFHGVLRPHDPSLFVPEKRDVHQLLEINGVPFEFRDMASCTRAGAE